MDLSNDLISKFVKITNDGDKKKTKEGTVYGTAVKYDGNMYVKIDGSDLLTPIDTTADIKEGERVTIMIKDHNATVTGNVTSPSASSADVKKVTKNVEEIEGEITEFEAIIADVVHVGELDAEVARIDELIAGKATIEDLAATNAEITNLKAKDAEIENLVADKATIEDLTATNAEITNLKAKDAEIENLVADKATIEDLTATNAEITNLKAKDVEIENLVADKATIEDLTATNAEITNLKAKDAEIENLVADKADITYLDANFATIDELEATHANIEVLDAEVASINTLVNGNLTSDNILSFNITSKNTTMEDAFIKDAMIDRITANKIMSGTIDTNNVTIQSTDGSMLLQGTLLQMKDDNGKVRIQIGKDTGGNFTFILYDESGTGVLIDEEGIKSSDAIADGLIVDAKVADNANISGSKLDIASVITEVNNDHSTTIKSNKIHLDEQNQSLEVAFNSLKSQVETIQDVTVGGDLSGIVTQVQSNTTQIEANKEGINTLVAENVIRTEEISDLEGELQQVNTTLSNKYTSLEQNLDGFKTTVSDTYTTKTEFNTLNIGSTNLVAGTKDFSSGWAYHTYYMTKTNETAIDSRFTGMSISFTPSTAGDDYADLGKTKCVWLEPDTEYTLSFWAKGTGKFYTYLWGTSVGPVASHYNSSGYSGTQNDGSSMHILSSNDTFKRYWVVYKTKSTTQGSYNLIATRVAKNLNTNVNMIIYGVKFEKGNKPTDWSPAPEDVQANIDAVDGKFANYSTTTQMNSAIQQKANEITSSVSSTYTTKTEFDNLKIGARNYVLNSGLTKDSSSFYFASGVSRDTSKKTPNGNNSIYFNISGFTTDMWMSGNQQIGNRLEVGKTYTIGANAFVPSNHGLDRGASLEIICWNSSDARTGTFYAGINTSIVDKWQSVSQTFTVPANTIRYTLQVYVVRNGKLYAGDYSLVEGNKSIWTPAPEDIQGQIDATNNNLANNYSTTTQMNSAINQKANEITSSVSSTYTTKTDFQNLAIGGRNLIRQSVVSGYAVASSSYDKNTATWTLTANAGAGETWGAGLVLSGDSVRIPYGKTYVLSFEIKVPRACSWNIDVNNYAVTGSSWSGNDNDNGSVRATSSKSLVANQWIKCWSRISNTASGNTNKVDIYDFSHFGVVMLNETSSMTFQIRNIQGEIGNIPSEYTPAPEDVQSQIDTINTNLTTYATKSELTQTNNSIVAKFSESGGYNLIKNSTGYGGSSGWTVSSGYVTSHQEGPLARTGNSHFLYFVNSSLITHEIYAYSSRFPLKGGKKYTLSGWFYMNPNVSNYDIFILTSNSLDANSTSTEYTYVHHSGARNNTGWEFVSLTFTTNSDVKSGIIRIDNNGYNGNGTTTNCNVHWSSLMLNEGSVALPWSPHPSEVYDGITKIDKDGVKVTQSNYNGYTHMKADGFYVNNGSENVISITKDGSYFKGKVVITSGSTVPTSVLSGTISSSQLNSTITSDISTAKSNASTAVSTANTASTNASNAVKTANTASTNASTAVSTANTANTNASNAVKTANTASTNASTAVSTANTAKSTAETANSTANSVKSTVDSGKTNWNNAYNRVNEWAYGAVTGSTTIDGGLIQANTILASKLALMDFTNYAQLNEKSAASWGFSYSNETAGTLYTMSSLARDKFISEVHLCNGGETLRIKGTIATTCKGYVNSSATSATYLGTAIGIYCYNGAGTSVTIVYSTRVTATSSGTETSIDSTVTIPSGARKFRVFVQTEGTSNFSGTIKLRNIQVLKCQSGELIVDGVITTAKIAAGAITAAKIASRTITADRIVSGAITANEIAANAITAAKISAGAITADKLAANAITSKTITGSTITGGTISGATITSETLMKTYGGMYVGSEIWGGFKKDSNGNYSSAQTFTIRGSIALQIDGNPTRISSVTGEVKIGDASSYDNLRAREIYAQEIIYTNDLRTRDAAQLSLSNVSMRSANAFIEFSSGYGVIRVKDRNHLYLQTKGNTGGDTSAEIRCTRYTDTSNYVNIRAYNVCAQNAVYANGVNVSSDINRKRDIELYSTDALQEVCSTPVYAYHLDTDKDEELKRIGIIMQEAPLDAIDLTGKGVDLYQMVTMLWRAVQQQQEIINELKGE